ncbi:MAG: hypothetical protein ACMUHB_06350 [Thermoplasmatota archaeon]
MRRSSILGLFVLSMVLMASGAFAIAYPHIFSTSKGELSVYQVSPVGIQIDRLAEGDSLHLWYSSDNPVGVYLMKRALADEFRSPKMDKEPLPPPISEGTEGSVSIEIQEGGDYEILFIPENPYSPEYQVAGEDGSYVVHVEYELERSVKREIVGFLVYGISLIILSVGSGVVGYLGYKRSRTADDDRRT